MFDRLTFSTLAYNKQRDNCSYGHLIQTINKENHLLYGK